MKRRFIFIFFLLASLAVRANSILIPMDEKQSNHLKAYGIAYWILRSDMEVDWILNYRGGSFMCNYHPAVQNELVVRGVNLFRSADCLYRKTHIDKDRVRA